MPVKTSQIPATLDHYLRTSADDDQMTTAAYVEKGSRLITTEAVYALRSMMPMLHKKAFTITESNRLRARVELLSRFFEESTRTAPVLSPALRDVTFALIYFLKGYDRIPDSIPEIGLVDDALIVETALQKNLAAFSEHWRKQGRRWPEEA